MPADAYNFSLAWRWTQSTHNVFPPDVMAQIKPLDHTAEPDGWSALWELAFCGFDLIQVTSADVSTEAGTKWLRALPVSLDEKVIVQWDPKSEAIETTWEIFKRYWDDFCYPASDDVAIYPRTNEWLLVYQHYQLFAWGRRIDERTLRGLCPACACPIAQSPTCTECGKPVTPRRINSA